MRTSAPRWTSILFVLVSAAQSACGPTAESDAAAEPIESATTSDSSAIATKPVRVAPVQDGATTTGLDALFADRQMTPLDGKPTSLSAWAADRPFVIAMRDLECPISKKYGPLTGRLSRDYARKGVPFLFLNTTLVDDDDAMREDRRRYGFEGAYVADRSLEFARALAATSTTEVFVFDAKRRMVYRGAIDDRHGFGFTFSQAKTEFLNEAIDAVLAGEQPLVKATTAPGCFLSLDRVSQKGKGLTYHEDIEPIIQARCQRCHRPGENAPFQLTDYDDVIARRGMIAYTVRQRVMPPWFADDGVGGPWIDDLRLSPAERDTILSWLEDGAPQGDPAAAPPPLPINTGWKIGPPDAVFQIEETFELPAEGEIPYQYGLVHTDFEQDRWLSRIEVKSNVPEALHHILVFEYLPEMRSVEPRFLGSLALHGYFAIQSPGVEPISYPPDRAKLLKKGTTLFFQVHYTPIGRTFTDRPEIAFTFADGPPENPVLCSAASSRQILIPPGAPDHVIICETTIPKKARLLGFNPHMHARGKSFEMELIYPDGTSETALRVSNWDFNWQQAFRLVHPKDVPALTRVKVTAHFDNSADNPANPDATQTVLFGLRTIDEMLIGYFEWVALD